MDALLEWMESDLDAIMVGTWMLCGNGWRLMWTLSWNLIWTLSWLAHVCSACSDVVVRPWMLSETTKVCGKDRDSNKKRRISRQNAVERSFQHTTREEKNSKTSSFATARTNNTTEKKCSKTHKENARCRPKLGNSNNENRPKQGVRAAGQPVGKNNQSGPSGQLHISDITTHQNLHKGHRSNRP